MKETHQKPYAREAAAALPMKVFCGLVIQKVAGSWSVLRRLDDPLVRTPRLYMYLLPVSTPSSCKEKEFGTHLLNQVGQLTHLCSPAYPPPPPRFLMPPCSLLFMPPTSYDTYYEEGVSHDVIGHVSLNEEVVHAMCSDGSIEGVVDGAVSHVRPIHTAAQVEVDGVATQSECLATLTHLNMLNPARKVKHERHGPLHV